MSHIVQTKEVEVSNIKALKKAVSQLETAELVSAGARLEHKLYARNKEVGVGVKLKDWRFPVVIDPEQGTVKYDNFGGSWGPQIELDKLLHGYSVAVAEQAADENYNDAYFYTENVYDEEGQLVGTNCIYEFE